MYYGLSQGITTEMIHNIFLYFICSSFESFALSLCCEIGGNCWSPTEKNEGTHTLGLNMDICNDTFNRHQQQIEVLFLNKCLA